MSEQETQDKKRKWRVSRRGFLIGLGATGGVLAVGVIAGRRPFHQFIAETLDSSGGAPANYTDDPWAWFEISPDNRIRLYLSKVEMGQGVHTSLAQMGIEELGIGWEQLEIVQGTTHVGPADSFGTGGSNSVSSTYEPLRQVAATLREMLRSAAAAQLGVAAADLEPVDGTFRVRSNPERALTYGEIVAATDEWEVPEEAPPLKSPDEHEFIGKSIPRVDLPAKIRGEALYGYDMRLPDMLYGAAAHPPRLGATLRRAAPGDAAAREGVVEVVVDGEFAGVVARTRRQAQLGLRGLELEWEDGPVLQQADLEEMVIAGGRGATRIQREGAGADPDEDGLRAEYRTPFAIHAHLEPQAALADVGPDRARIWVSIQMTSSLQNAAAEMLGMEPEQVEIIPTYLGGGFGRRLGPVAAAMEAARLSQAVGRPVHVGWTRPDEMQLGFYRPPTHSVMAARLENGRIAALRHDQASGEVAFPFFPSFLKGVFGSDFGAWRGARLLYRGIPNLETTAKAVDLPVRTGWWRGLGLMANIFAIESFMDELAAAAGADPLQFRLDHLGDDEDNRRLARLLTTVAERAGWGNEPPAGRARGIACSADYGTMAVMVAEVSVDQGSGEIRVHKATIGIDPGLIVNPDGASAQTQGCVVMGLSSTLLEEMTVADSAITASNFDRYPLITLDRVPEIDVVLQSTGDVPRGLGEPPIGPVAASVANAVYALTGARLRRLPLTPERVLAAL